MPRQARLDAPGVLHHVMVRGIEGRPIFLEYVLKRFSEERRKGIRGYREFMEEGKQQGRRLDLVGGGLIRSLGGWYCFSAY